MLDEYQTKYKQAVKNYYRNLYKEYYKKKYENAIKGNSTKYRTATTISSHRRTESTKKTQYPTYDYNSKSTAKATTKSPYAWTYCPGNR